MILCFLWNLSESNRLFPGFNRTCRTTYTKVPWSGEPKSPRALPSSWPTANKEDNDYNNQNQKQPTVDEQTTTEGQDKQKQQ